MEWFLPPSANTTWLEYCRTSGTYRSVFNTEVNDERQFYFRLLRRPAGEPERRPGNHRARIPDARQALPPRQRLHRMRGQVRRGDQSLQVLSDPAKRAAYDIRYEQIKHRRWKLASAVVPSSNGNGNRDQEIRNAVLSVLYIERRNDPSAASVGLWQLEKILGWPEKTLEFHTWYLKEKGWIQRTDSGGVCHHGDRRRRD